MHHKTLALRWLIFAWAGILLATVGRTDDPTVRPAAWATKIERPGLPNLHKVNDQLYRGAQPNAEGFRQLEKLGVKTVLNLRSRHSNRDICGADSLTLMQIRMSPWDVTENDIVRFLRVVTDQKRQPVFVHCQHGADRTGVMCAAYRVVVEGWTKQQAIDEMTCGGFGFHWIWGNLPKLIERLNVDNVRAKAGLNQQP
jgi:protein tyrosine phosphatase (PTP) superfamily phosphohydrolase (DUF442 family)